MNTKSKEYPNFIKWLESCGAEILSPLNEWELLRFKTWNMTHVIHVNKKGVENWPTTVKKMFNKFKAGKHLVLSRKTKIKGNERAYREALIYRDGDKCFFCHKAVEDDDITIEHLLSRNDGGPHKIGNMAIAHSECNNKAGHMSLFEKIRLRDRMIAGDV